MFPKHFAASQLTQNLSQNCFSETSLRHNSPKIYPKTASHTPRCVTTHPKSNQKLLLKHLAASQVTQNPSKHCFSGTSLRHNSLKIQSKTASQTHRCITTPPKFILKLFLRHLAASQLTQNLYKNCFSCTSLRHNSHKIYSKTFSRRELAASQLP